jgi:cysteine desulfurase
MPVYLDHAASTPVVPAVAELLAGRYGEIGNASSVHQFGQQAKLRLEQARDRIAAAVDCHASEVLFTSGGTEANNLAIFGTFEQRNAAGDRPLLATLPTEHHAVLEAVDSLEQRAGARVAVIGVDTHGLPNLAEFEAFAEANQEQLALVTAMLANNETGVVVDVKAMAEICKRLQIPFHTDAVAAVGHLPVSFRDLGVSSLAFTGHKIGAPVGVGALLVARSAKLKPLFRGGNQERGIRPGTQDVIGAEALALATELAVSQLTEKRAHWELLRSQLIGGVMALVPEAVVAGLAEHSPLEARLSNIVDFIFPGCRGDALLFLLDSAGVAISNGSACSAGVSSASHVLAAMGYSEADASSCVRVSFGPETSHGEIEQVLLALQKVHPLAKQAGV